jgi:hypothetical protein
MKLPIKEVPRLFLAKHSFNFKKVNFKVAVTELYPRIPLEVVAEPLESAGVHLGTIA